MEFSLANMGCNYELKWMEELTANEVYYTKISEIKAALFFYRQKQNEKPRSMLNQSKEVLCICVSFQESGDLIKEKPEVNVYDMFLSH